jgi:hypothetical protein
VSCGGRGSQPGSADPRRFCWHYRHCGLTAASALALPELGEPPGEDVGAPDVRIAIDAPETVARDWSFVCSDHACTITAPEVGRLEVRGGRTIEVSPWESGDPALLRLLVLGSAWGALLHQRGHLPLHAGVIASDDGAYALCGGQGAGKSSAVSWFLARGYRLLSDDLTRLDIAGDSLPNVWPSVAQVKLTRAAIEHRGWDAGGLAPGPAEKLVLPWRTAPAGAEPLRAVVVLRWGRMRLGQLAGLAAVRAIVEAATYRRHLYASPPELTRHWRDALDIARQVPVFELTRPKLWTGSDSVMAELEAALVQASA